MGLERHVPKARKPSAPRALVLPQKLLVCPRFSHQKPFANMSFLVSQDTWHTQQTMLF